MDVRVCFRVRERRDTDLILGQGMLNAGWHAHRLNAPGKFLVSAPEHGTPKRARGYLVTDEAVSDTATLHASIRPALDEESRRAIETATDSGDHTHDRQPASEAQESTSASPEDALWMALCVAPDEGSEIGELMRLTGMSRPTLYRHLGQHVKASRAVQVSRGRWRASTTEEPMS